MRLCRPQWRLSIEEAEYVSVSEVVGEARSVADATTSARISLEEPKSVIESLDIV
jgi:hypothetical protein